MRCADALLNLSPLTVLSSRQLSNELHIPPPTDLRVDRTGRSNYVKCVADKIIENRESPLVSDALHRKRIKTRRTTENCFFFAVKYCTDFSTATM